MPKVMSLSQTCKSNLCRNKAGQAFLGRVATFNVLVHGIKSLLVMPGCRHDQKKLPLCELVFPSDDYISKVKLTSKSSGILPEGAQLDNDHPVQQRTIEVYGT